MLLQNECKLFLFRSVCLKYALKDKSGWWILTILAVRVPLYPYIKLLHFFQNVCSDLNETEHEHAHTHLHLHENVDTYTHKYIHPHITHHV